MSAKCAVVVVVGVLASTSFAACVSNQNGGAPVVGDGGLSFDGAPPGTQDGATPPSGDSSSPSTPETGTSTNDGGADGSDAGGGDGAAPASGTLDPGFGGQGFVIAPTLVTADGGVAVSQVGDSLTVDGQGRIVMAGYAYGTYISDFVTAWRFLPTGAPDTTFGTAGLFVTGGGGSDDSARGVCIDPAGNILLAGEDYSDGMEVWRVTSAGVLDSTFGTDGEIQVPGGGVGYAVVCTAAGTVIVGNGSPDGAQIYRYTNAGVLDTTGFGSPNGYTGDPIYGGGRMISVTVDATGNVVAGGMLANSLGASFGPTVLRATSAGVLDTTFDGTGADLLAKLDAGAGPDAATFVPGSLIMGVATDTTNDVLVALGSGVARLTPTGAFDTTFGEGGAGYVPLPVPSAVTAPNSTAFVNGVAVDSKGRILVAGSTNPATAGPFYMAVWRLLPTGALDTTFGEGGTFAITGTAGGTVDYAYAVTVDATDHPLIVGTSATAAGAPSKQLAVVWRLAP